MAVEWRRRALDDITARISLICGNHSVPLLRLAAASPEVVLPDRWMPIATRVARHGGKVVAANPRLPFPPVTTAATG